MKSMGIYTMNEYWVKMGISEEVFNELSFKLTQSMKYSAEKTTRETHADEDSFFTKFMGRLVKIEFGDGYYIDFQDSKTTSKGKNSAEKKYGCDFGLRVDFIGNNSSFPKAIIGQAKNFPRNSPRDNSTEQKRLAEQCSKMAKVTPNYIVTFRPNRDGQIPVIYLGDMNTGSYLAKSIRFDEYLLKYVLPCYHGETEKDVIKYMVSATHEGWTEYLRIFPIKTNLPKPSPSPENKITPMKRQ